MKGIEKITARIESDGKAETVQMLKEAEEKAAALLAGYKAKAEEETAAAVEAGKEAAVHQAERLESAAHMEAKKQYLLAKNIYKELGMDDKVEELEGLMEILAVEGEQEDMERSTDNIQENLNEVMTAHEIME